MKKLLIVIALAGASLVWADRTDIWSATSVQVIHVELDLLPDGGCAVSAEATYSLADGGNTIEQRTRKTEVGGANRTVCLDILNSRAPVLFRADKGL